MTPGIYVLYVRYTNDPCGGFIPWNDGLAYGDLKEARELKEQIAVRYPGARVVIVKLEERE